MSYKKPNSTNEAQLRDAILSYFQEGVSVEGMQEAEPFKQWVSDQRFTWERIKIIRRSMTAAGLLEQMRGTTADLVLRTTDIGRQAMQAEPER